MIIPKCELSTDYPRSADLTIICALAPHHQFFASSIPDSCTQFMGPWGSITSRVPGPKSIYYPEASKYLNLRMSIRNKPLEFQINILKQLGAVDGPDILSKIKDPIVEMVYAEVLLKDDTSESKCLEAALAANRNDYPFCQRMLLEILPKTKHGERDLIRYLTNKMAKEGNPYLKLIELCQQRDETPELFELCRGFDWDMENTFELCQTLDDDVFIDLSDLGEPPKSLSSLVLSMNDVLVIQTLKKENCWRMDHVIRRETWRNCLMKVYDCANETPFSREIEALSRMKHPSIQKLLGFVCPTGTHGGALVYPLDGFVFLGDKLRARDGLSLFDITKAFLGLVIGMRYVHSRKIVHCGLHPDSVVFDAYGWPVIWGFGNCRLDEDDTGWSTEEISPAYCAPELWVEGPVTEKADSFSFAMIMYEAITGNQAFPRASPATIRKLCESGTRPNLATNTQFEKLQPVVVDIIERCWSVDPDSRYSFQEIYEKLESVGFWVCREYDEVCDKMIQMFMSSDGMQRPAIKA